MTARTRWVLIVLVVVALDLVGAFAFTAVLPTSEASLLSFFVGVALGCAGMLYGLAHD